MENSSPISLVASKGMQTVCARKGSPSIPRAKSQGSSILKSTWFASRHLCLSPASRINDRALNRDLELLSFHFSMRKRRQSRETLFIFYSIHYPHPEKERLWASPSGNLEKLSKQPCPPCATHGKIALLRSGKVNHRRCICSILRPKHPLC